MPAPAMPTASAGSANRVSMLREPASYSSYSGSNLANQELQALEDPALESEQAFVVFNRAARPRQRLFEFGDNAARRLAHHQDPIAEQNGLADIVRYEHDGLAVLTPDLHQFLLRKQAGLAIERG